MKAKLLGWTVLFLSLVGLSFSSGYSLIPKQFLPFRWAISLTPVGLLQGALESDERKVRVVRYIMTAPAIRPGYFDLPYLWLFGVVVAVVALALLALHFPRSGRCEK